MFLLIIGDCYKGDGFFGWAALCAHRSMNINNISCHFDEPARE